MTPWNEQCMRFGLKHEMVGVEQILKIVMEVLPSN